MKFRNPETGEMFKSNVTLRGQMTELEVVEDIIKTVPGHEPLSAEQQKDMAEFIDEKLTEKKEANMDKPLKDWTLEEVKECCSKYGTCVSECPFSAKNKLCRMTSNPCDWDLTDKPRWTQQEVEDAKKIVEIIPLVYKFERNKNGVLSAVCSIPDIGDDFCLLNRGLLPSIQPGQSYTLDEIIGGAE